MFLVWAFFDLSLRAIYPTEGISFILGELTSKEFVVEFWEETNDDHQMMVSVVREAAMTEYRGSISWYDQDGNHRTHENYVRLRCAT